MLISSFFSDACFIYFICHSISKVLSKARKSLLSDMKTMSTISAIASEYVSWISAFLAKQSYHSSASDLHWSKKYCKCCRADIVKTLVTLTSVVMRFCCKIATNGKITNTIMQNQPLTSTQFIVTANLMLFPVARSCLLSLHQLWTTDPDFVNILGTSPIIQRQYLWITKQLDRMRPSLNLHPYEGQYYTLVLPKFTDHMHICTLIVVLVYFTTFTLFRSDNF